jgi:hypothetical protein
MRTALVFAVLVLGVLILEDAEPNRHVHQYRRLPEPIYLSSAAPDSSVGSDSNVVPMLSDGTDTLKTSGSSASSLKTTSRVQPFVESDYVSYADTGIASIEGTIAYKKHLATGDVWLDPMTPYSTSVLTQLWNHYQEPRKMAAGWSLPTGDELRPPDYTSSTVVPFAEGPLLLDPRAMKYRRSVRAGAHGSFEFRELPPGTYYLWARISWASQHTVDDQLLSDRNRSQPERAPSPYGTMRWSAVCVHRTMRLGADDHVSISIKE